MRFVLATLLFGAPLFAQVCDFSVTPTTLDVPNYASQGKITVITGPSCSWQAASNASWLKVTSGGSYTGGADVSYTVDPSVTAALRTGTFTIAGQTVTIRQAAQSCSFGIAPKSATLAVAGGSGSFSVTANCV